MRAPLTLFRNKFSFYQDMFDKNYRPVLSLLSLFSVIFFSLCNLSITGTTVFCLFGLINPVLFVNLVVYSFFLLFILVLLSFHLWIFTCLITVINDI